MRSRGRSRFRDLDAASCNIFPACKLISNSSPSNTGGYPVAQEMEDSGRKTRGSASARLDTQHACELEVRAGEEKFGLT